MSLMKDKMCQSARSNLFTNVTLGPNKVHLGPGRQMDHNFLKTARSKLFTNMTNKVKMFGELVKGRNEFNGR